MISSAEVTKQENRLAAFKRDLNDPAFRPSEYLDNLPAENWKQFIQLTLEGKSEEAMDMIAPHIEEYAEERWEDLTA